MNIRAETTVAILPLGAHEQHGPHLPFETDAIIAGGIANRLCEALNGRVTIELLPVETVGYSPEHMDYPGSRTYPFDEAVKRWTEIGEAVAARGVKRFLLLNAHGGNSPLLSIVATELRCHVNMLCVATSWLRFGEPDGLLEEGERAFGIHGGDIETSVMLALAPDKVAMERADNFDSLQRQLVEENKYLHAYGRHAFGWKMQDLNPAGVTGNAAAATAEKGEALIAHSVEGLCQLVEEIAEFDLSRFENQPVDDTL